MHEYPLVSIITPCYNGEKFVKRYFDSVLRQTYPNIELFFVNDGSRDKTEEIALDYKKKFEDKGFKFHYFYQDNAGQAAAINKVLPLIKGKYLTWPDSDDWITPHAVARRVEFLEENPHLGLVQSRSAVVSEKDLTKVIRTLYRKHTENGWIFDGLLFENDAPITSGSFMVNADRLLSMIPNKQIYDSRTGQNWQLMLPLCYKYECGFLSDYLYYIVIRRDSHSHLERDFDSIIRKTYRHEDTLIHVLNEIDMPDNERRDYLSKLSIHFIRKRMTIASYYHRRSDMKRYYKELLDKDAIERADYFTYAKTVFPPLDLASRAANRGMNKLYKIVHPSVFGSSVDPRGE